MDVTFHPEALVEFKAQISYYEKVQPGLGSAFADEVMRLVELARLFPRLGSPEEFGIRTLVTKRFPFLIYYEPMDDKLWIYAVMHAARAPGYWKSRKRG